MASEDLKTVIADAARRLRIQSELGVSSEPSMEALSQFTTQAYRRVKLIAEMAGTSQIWNDNGVKSHPETNWPPHKGDYNIFKAYLQNDSLIVIADPSQVIIRRMDADMEEKYLAVIPSDIKPGQHWNTAFARQGDSHFNPIADVTGRHGDKAARTSGYVRAAQRAIRDLASAIR